MSSFRILCNCLLGFALMAMGCQVLNDRMPTTLRGRRAPSSGRAVQSGKLVKSSIAPDSSLAPGERDSQTGGVDSALQTVGHRKTLRTTAAMIPQTTVAPAQPGLRDHGSGDQDDSGLLKLQQQAIAHNPALQELLHRYEAARARCRYVDQLPDPRFGLNVFGSPLETAAGSQQMNMGLSQTIPWLEKLDATRRKACCEAMAAAWQYQARRQQIVSELRSEWLRLYVIDRNIEIAKANQNLLESLLRVVNSRVATGKSLQGDVSLGTLELSRLQDRLLQLNRERITICSNMNRLAGQQPTAEFGGPERIRVGMPEIEVDDAMQDLLEHQPLIQVARLQIQADRWGFEMARLARRPDLTLSANLFVTDGNRPAGSAPFIGNDPWAIGIQMNLPLWDRKYDAMEGEARSRLLSRREELAALTDRYERLIVDLLAEAYRAEQTVLLYRRSILPQARQVLESDQKAYANSVISFDRVIRSFRNLLTLEAGFHAALGDLGIASNRLQEATGTEVPLRAIESDPGNATE